MEELFKISCDKEDFEVEQLNANANPNEETAADSASGGSPTKSVRPSRLPRGGMPPVPPVPHAASSASLALSETSQPGSSVHHGSIGSASGQQAAVRVNLSDMLDHRIDRILKEWHQSSDLLFAVHPVDGSLLVWVADFMDEYQPGNVRSCLMRGGFDKTTLFVLLTRLVPSWVSMPDGSNPIFTLPTTPSRSTNQASIGSWV